MTDGAPDPPARRWDLSERRLYLCTPDRDDLEAFVDACIAGGVDVVQLRDKHLADPDLIARGRVVQQVCARHRVPFILNDRPDLAVAVDADGVHVGQDDLPARAARAQLGDHRLLGLSTHARAELATAVDQQLPVDYVSAGPVHATPTKPGRPGTGLGYIREAVFLSPWPVWITGGVDPDTVGEMIGAGARHFVAVRWLTDAADPAGHARQLRQAIDDGIAEVGTPG
ncbi:MAG TPA: thiamine phosphate synthase [Acidimicrobiales bacterium]|nr:thiamine phosphate synthase [Acidimicrobiales bacterium]